MLPIAGAAAFGIVVVAILTAHQGIPLVVLIFAVLLGIGGYVLKETQFGLFLYAVGNNDEAARRAGVKVPRIKMAAFAIAGGIAALAGIIAASRTLGVGRLLRRRRRRRHAAARVHRCGGDRRREPLRRPWRHPRGAARRLVIGTVSNGLNLMGVENEIRLIVTGLLLVLAVSIDKLIEKATGQQSF